MTENAITCAWHPIETKNSIYNKQFSTGELPIEPNRYSLVWGAFCPWATPVAILIDLSGLDQVIYKSPVYPLRHSGINDDWFFGKDDSTVDPILKTNRLSQSYQKTDPNFTGRAGVPSLVDVQTGRVVNADPNELLTELIDPWTAYTKDGTKNLFQPKLREAIQATNQKIIDNLSTVIGKIETVSSQESYNQLVNQYFNQLEEFDKQLSSNQYLLGDQLTIADILVFVRLVRFDLVYYFKDKLNKKRLTDFRNLWRYAKNLYQIPAFKKNTDFLAIKQHFFQVSENIEDFNHVLPVGPDTAKWEN